MGVLRGFLAGTLLLVVYLGVVCLLGYALRRWAR